MTRHRNRRRRYAQGKHAIAECERSGQKMRYQDLVEDGHIPGLLVHPDWYEPRNPQELPVDTSDAVALFRPAPEKSRPDGEFDNIEQWRAWIIANTPATPTVPATTTLAVAAQQFTRQLVLEQPQKYPINAPIWVTLDAGSPPYYVGRTATRTDVPQFVVPLLNRWEVTPASIGNDVFIGTV